MGNKQENKSDFATRKQIDKIVSSAPDIKREARDFTKLDGGEL